MNTNNTLTKTDSLCLKGLAIILMIFHHCFLNQSRYEGFSLNFFPFSENFIVFICSYFKICVSIFAFISGYGLYCSIKKHLQSSKSITKWSISRLFKTMSGFYFVYIIVFVSTWIYADFPSEKYCHQGIIHGILYAFIDSLGLASTFNTPTLCGTWWYMGVAIFFIAILPPLILAINKCGFFTLSILLILIPRAIAIRTPGGNSGFYFIFIFILGILFEKYNLFERLNNIRFFRNVLFDSLFKFVFYFSALISTIYLYSRINRTMFWEFHFVLAPLVFICFAQKYILAITSLRRILSLFGRHSMNIFLIHTLIRSTFFKAFTYSFKHFLLIGLVLLMISLFISIIIEQFKKYTHYDKFVQKTSAFVCAKIDNL